MKNYLLKIKEAIFTNLGSQVDESGPLYTVLLIIPINILAEISFFLRGYILALPLGAVNILRRRPLDSIGIFGVAISFLCFYPIPTGDINTYYVIVGAVTILAFWASTKVLVVKNTPFTLVFGLNKLITSLITAIGTGLIIVLLNTRNVDKNALVASMIIITLFSLLGAEFRASVGRRSSMLMVSSFLLYPVFPKYYLVGLLTSTVFILVPAIYFYMEKQKEDEGRSDYTHRDLEIMKLFGQASASGYAFEERLIPLIDSVGYETKFALWYKNEKKDYPIEFAETKGEGGIDLIAMSPESILVIQCKFYSTPIEAFVVAETSIAQEAFVRHYAKKGDRRRVTAMIITNSKFDNTAIAHAKMKGIILVDGEAIKKMARTGKF